MHMSTAVGPIVLLFIAALTYGQTAGGAPAEYQPKGSIREYFLGAWKLVSAEHKYSDGHTTPYPELGPHAVGFLMYAPSGHMSAQLMKPGRPHWSETNAPTVAEAASALDGFISYCGAFEIRENERVMIHRPETASSPNYPGTTQERPYHRVNEDRFFFRGPGMEKQKDGTEAPVTWTITWERLK
jgi:Lipocalin-like domain